MPYIIILLIYIPKRGICIYTGHFTEDASLNKNFSCEWGKVV